MAILQMSARLSLQMSGYSSETAAAQNSFPVAMIKTNAFNTFDPSVLKMALGGLDLSTAALDACNLLRKSVMKIHSTPTQAELDASSINMHATAFTSTKSSSSSY
ncbi:uncharacterized [Tachysurus ichikawai]